MDYKDIISSAQRGVSAYKIGEHEVTLREMSVTQQFKWDDLKKQNNDDIESIFVNLIKWCCDELSEAPIDEIRNIAPSHIIGMGNKIIELSGNNEKKE